MTVQPLAAYCLANSRPIPEFAVISQDFERQLQYFTSGRQNTPQGAPTCSNFSGAAGLIRPGPSAALRPLWSQRSSPWGLPRHSLKPHPAQPLRPRALPGYAVEDFGTDVEARLPAPP